MLFDSISIFLPLLFISTFTLVVAQDSTPDATPASSAPPDPSPWPTATVFLPGSLHELPGNGKHLAASIITAVCQVAEHISYIFSFSLADNPTERESNRVRSRLHARSSQCLHYRTSRLQLAILHHRNRRREHINLHLQPNSHHRQRNVSTRSPSPSSPPYPKPTSIL